MPRGGARPGAGRKAMTNEGGRAPRYQLTLELALFNLIDGARQRVGGGVNRSEFVRRAVVRAMERIGAGEAPLLLGPLEGYPVKPGASGTLALPLRMSPELRAAVEAAAGTEHGDVTRFFRGAIVTLATEVLGRRFSEAHRA